MRNARSGMTIIELSLTMLIFGVLSLALLNGLSLSESSRKTVESSSKQNVELRAALRAVADTLRVSNEDHVTLFELPDESTQITVQVPLAVGGGVAWGAPAEHVARVGGTDEPGWSLRYEVVAGADQTRRLVRRVLDEDGNQMRSEVVATGLALGAAGGAGSLPGLAVARTGDVWQLSIALAGEASRSVTTNVCSRN